jgi:LPXTG-site transpeptidase (sortase) family protein
MDMVVKPKTPPKPAPHPASPPVSKVTSPAIPIDDLLNDFIEEKPKSKKPAKIKKTPGKTTNKRAMRKQAKAEKAVAKKRIVRSSEIKKPDFTERVLVAMADSSSMSTQAPTPLAWGGGETAVVAESENVLDKLNQIPRIAFEFKINKKRIFAFIRTIIVAAILAVSGYLMWDMLLSNKTVQETMSSSAAAVAIDEMDPSGIDVTSISNRAWAAHTVPADQARYLYLPTINARARIISVGISSKGKIDAPKNVNDVAWYDGSAKPNQEGQVFINGYTAFASTYKAAFDRLDELRTDDRITIERGDGKIIDYRVVSIETVSADKVDMKKILNVPDEAIRGLTLMGCTGKFNYRTQSSDTRVIVYAVQV